MTAVSRRVVLSTSTVALVVVAAGAWRSRTPSLALHAGAPGTGGSVITHDTLVAARQPGPHGGGGETTAYDFFARVDGMPLVFRKRALHPGSAIGHHPQKEDEVYYVLSGEGEFTLDGVVHRVGPGTAMLTRSGSSHAIRPIGREDLLLLIAYPTDHR
jgi:mannose-6-phosphate isomerase-like protein (cupin superfamily)